jgi:hypothetical protein
MRHRLVNEFLSNPTAIALAVVAAVVIGAVWFYTQMQETKEAESFKAGERNRPDSIWKD